MSLGGQPVDGTPSIAELADELMRFGVRRIHVLAWRDLDDPDAGGSEVHADELMTRWAAAGLDVTHRTSAAAGRPATATRHGYRVVRRGGRMTVFPRTVLAELGRRMGRFDAVVEVWNGVPWLTPLWCRPPRLTIFHHVHGPMWGQILPGPLAAFGRVLEARLAPPLYRRDTVATPSSATRDELLELGFRADRVVVAENGVDTRFTPGGSRDDAPLVVCVGRLAPVKRQHEMIDAAVIARRRVPNLQLVIIGDGPLLDDLASKVDTLGASDWVRLVGHQTPDELVTWYRRAWLLSSASLAEGWGLTVTEAAACGTTAVVTNINGHRCSVVDGVTGVLADLADLGDTIADVLLDDERRSSLESAALRRAATLTWDATARRVLEALRDRAAVGGIRSDPS